MREFSTAIHESEKDPDEEEPLVFTIDGQELRAYKPTEGQFAMLVMVMGRHVTDLDQAGGVIDFFVSMLDEPSTRYVTNRLLTRKNPMPVETIVDVLSWMIEEWGGRPFSGPSGSTPSRRNGGRKSTPRTRPLTSSASPSTGS